MKKETPQQKQLSNIIREFDLKNKRMPTISELSELTGKKQIHIKRVLTSIEIYPREMLLTEDEQLLLILYRPGIKMRDLEKRLDLSGSTLRLKLKYLSDLGLIEEYKPREYISILDLKPEPLKDDATTDYVTVISGPHEGASGYIESYTWDGAKCVLFKDGTEFEVEVNDNDYKRCRRPHEKKKYSSKYSSDIYHINPYGPNYTQVERVTG